MRIAIVGAGYVGLVTGACLAETGNDVCFVDTDPARVADLQVGRCSVYEAGLDRLVERNVRAERLHATSDLAEGVRGRKIVFLCLPTNPLPDGRCDTSILFETAAKLGPLIDPHTVLVVKSTAPVGTTQRVKEAVTKNSKVPFSAASNPEFLREGTAVTDFFKPDRIILGVDSEEAYETLFDLYQPFVRTNKPILRMDPASAELSKYAANAYLAMRISFINEIALLTEKLGADIPSVRRGIGTDPRIGEGFLFPGPGYGGSCFPKDVMALREMGREAGLPLQLIEATDRANERQKAAVVEKITRAVGGDVRGKKIALWGLAFKAGTDDCRESVSIHVIDSLHAQGAILHAYDPEARAANLGESASRVTLVPKPYEVLDGAHVLAVLTEWNEFREPDFDEIKKRLAAPAIVDARNLYRRSRLEKLGFRYSGIGGQK
ncbi:MAG: UDP-glucose/GDP-mannose dehydrogenase family protein [Bdellovibrionota bacterium]